MPAPCSNDLRWQNVWLALGIRKTTDETARLMGVTRRTVVNILQRFRRYGSVRPSRIGRPNTMSSITRGESFMLLEYVNALSRSLLERSDKLHRGNLWP